MNWRRLAAIGLSLCVGMAMCYPGQLMDRTPHVYEDRLRTLNFALALNDNWSAVWSETLKRAAVAKPPDASLCEEIVPADNPEADDDADDASESRTYEPFDLISRIVNKCWYSGAFVQYGVRLLGHAANCLFCRHAALHLVAVNLSLTDDDGPGLNGLLQRLIGDYRVVVDKLAAVDVPLRYSLQVATFFDDVDKMTAEMRGKSSKKVNEMKAEINRVLDQLLRELSSYRDTYCLVTADDWYDADTEKMVTLTLDSDVPEPSAADGSDQSPRSSSVLDRADRLRSLMRRVFDGLRITGMPQTVWKEIFHSNIFVRTTDLQATGTGAPTR